VSASKESFVALSGHKGSARSGSGNHRASIFRLLVGNVLIKKNNYAFPTWDNGTSSSSAEVRAAERLLECEVSKVIGAMRLVWLPIEDAPGPASKRSFSFDLPHDRYAAGTAASSTAWK
jgi:hypothetical protein